MGVDTKILLPANVRVHDVAKIIGISLGLKPIKELIRDTEDSWYVRVPSVTVENFITNALVECADLNFIAPNDEKFITGYFNHQVMYFFEGRDGKRLLMPKSTPWWIAIGRKLVDFYGGSLDYNDCDDIDCDLYIQEKPTVENSPEDDEPWHNLQERIFNVTPLTKDYIKACDAFAAYKLKDFK